MSKVFTFLLITALSTTSVHAQKNLPGKKQLNWGIKTGMNFSTLHMDNIGSIKPGWKTGFVFGSFFRIKAGKNFMVQPELLYSSMGGIIERGQNDESTQRLNYFSIPVLANFGFAKKWRAVLGPQFDFLIIGKKFQTSKETEVTDSYDDNSINLTGGFEFWPIKKIGICARYIQGLNNISENNNSVKNMGAQLTVALRL